MSQPNYDFVTTNPLQRLQTTDSSATNMTTEADNFSIYSEKAALLLPSQDGSHPGFAPEKTLSRGLQVPAKSWRLTSGFEYPAVLSQYGISQETWTEFTGEITEKAKLSSAQMRIVIGSGIGIMAIGGMMLGVLGAIPAVMVAKRTRANQENRNLAAAMGLPSPAPFYSSSKWSTKKEAKRAGRSKVGKGEAKGSDENAYNKEEEEEEEEEEDVNSLPHRIKHWNETFFEPRGLLIRIDMPYDDSASEADLDVHVRSGSTGSKRYSPTSSLQGYISSMEKEEHERQKAVFKAKDRCRIVIIPLKERPGSVMSQATTLAGESPSIPAAD